MFTELSPICQALWWAVGVVGEEAEMVKQPFLALWDHRLIGRKCQKPRDVERQHRTTIEDLQSTRQAVIVSLMWATRDIEGRCPRGSECGP